MSPSDFDRVSQRYARVAITTGVTVLVLFGVGLLIGALLDYYNVVDGARVNTISGYAAVVVVSLIALSTLMALYPYRRQLRAAQPSQRPARLGGPDVAATAAAAVVLFVQLPDGWNFLWRLGAAIGLTSFIWLASQYAASYIFYELVVRVQKQVAARAEAQARFAAQGILPAAQDLEKVPGPRTQRLMEYVARTWSSAAILTAYSVFSGLEESGVFGISAWKGPLAFACVVGLLVLGPALRYLWGLVPEAWKERHL